MILKTMNVVQEEKKADESARTSILRVYHGIPVVLEEDLGLHLVIYNETANFHFGSLIIKMKLEFSDDGREESKMIGASAIKKELILVRG